MKRHSMYFGLDSGPEVVFLLLVVVMPTLTGEK